MLGFMVMVYRQPDNRDSPAEPRQPRSSLLAVWRTDLNGLKWVRDHAGSGDVINLGGDGYPSEFTATASVVIPEITSQMSSPHRVWAIGENDIVTSDWLARDTYFRDEIDRCDPSEWLHIIAWDES